MPESLLDYALEYAKRGWYVFPVREKPGAAYIKDGEKITPKEKQPYIRTGLNGASIDSDQIKAWWKTWPTAMIGINCGKSGLFVVDLDVKNTDGIFNFNRLGIDTGGSLNSKTPSGGLHIIFSGNGKSTGNGKLGIDTRGEGGYFIAPPSVIVSGDKPGAYMAIGDWNKTPAQIPDGLIKAISPVAVYQNSPIQNDKGMLSRSTLLFMTEGARKGERNNMLFNALADFVGCGYTKDECREKLWPVCEKIEIGKSEFEQTLEHAFSKERMPSIPLSIQKKMEGDYKKASSSITDDEAIIIEKALLGCIIRDNSIIIEVEDILNSDDFCVNKHRDIFTNILSLHNNGVKADIVTLSTNGISLNDINLLTQEYNIPLENAVSYAIVLREISALRKFKNLMNKGSEYATSGKSLAEIVTTVESKLADISIYGGVKTSAILDSSQAIDIFDKQIIDMANGKVSLLKTGFADYDKISEGLYPAELLILTARPGEGKSALILSLINNIGIINHKPVLFFTLEMTTRETIARLICQMTGIPFKNVFRGSMSELEWAKYDEAKSIIKRSKIFFDDSSGLTIPEMRVKSRKLKEKENIEFVGIDQLEQIKGYANLNPSVQFDKIAYDIRALAKDLDIPFGLCHQLNRGITDRKLHNPEPELSDLNQAGEKPATQVWAIVHKKENDKIIHSKIKILKNRNGAKYSFNTNFIGERMLFTNLADENENDKAFLKEKDYLDDPDNLPDCARD